MQSNEFAKQSYDSDRPKKISEKKRRHDLLGLARDLNEQKKAITQAIENATFHRPGIKWTAREVMEEEAKKKPVYLKRKFRSKR